MWKLTLLDMTDINIYSFFCLCILYLFVCLLIIIFSVFVVVFCLFVCTGTDFVMSLGILFFFPRGMGVGMGGGG